MFRSRGYGFNRGGYGSYGGRRGRDGYFWLLMFQLVSKLYSMPNKPPVTIALFAAQCLVFFKDMLNIQELSLIIPDLHDGCMSPFFILQRGEWSRLIWAAFLHADENHLYYNLASLVWKGSQLELTLGSAYFGAMIAELLIVSNCLTMMLSLFLADSMLDYRSLGTTCVAGFSGVLFGLTVVMNHRTPGWTHLYGIAIPTKYLSWAELVLASWLNPRASFIGHICGIIAGYIHILFTSKYYGTILRAFFNFFTPGPETRGGSARRGYFNSSGTSGTTRTQQPPPQQPQTRTEPSANQRPPPTASSTSTQAPRRDHGADAGPSDVPVQTAGFPGPSMSADEIREARLRRFEQKKAR